jgi:hypothetical protein
VQNNSLAYQVAADKEDENITKEISYQESRNSQQQWSTERMQVKKRKKGKGSIRRQKTGVGVDLMQKWQQKSPASPPKGKSNKSKRKDLSSNATAAADPHHHLMVPLLLLWQDPAPFPHILITGVQAFAALRLTRYVHRALWV